MTAGDPTHPASPVQERAIANDAYARGEAGTPRLRRVLSFRDLFL